MMGLNNKMAVKLAKDSWENELDEILEKIHSRVLKGLWYSYNLRGTSLRMETIEKLESLGFKVKRTGRSTSTPLGDIQPVESISLDFSENLPEPKATDYGREKPQNEYNPEVEKKAFELVRAMDYGWKKPKNEYNPEVEKKAFELAKEMEGKGVTLEDLIARAEPVVAFKAAMLLAFYGKLYYKPVDGKIFRGSMTVEEVFTVMDEYFK